jgi:ubiquinone/menaquinone biosynthesis methyltransferase
MDSTNLKADELLKSKKEVPFEFNRVAVKYDFATSLSQGYQKDMQRSVDRMSLTGDEYLADLCCGTGKSSIACLNNLPNGTVLGIDNSKGMLESAAQKFYDQVKLGSLKFELNDVMELDYPDNTFDAIFMAYGIRNMPDHEKCLQNLKRMLKPGGVICFHEYSLNNNLFANLYWKILGYGVIIPISGIISGSTKIYSYLVKSVLSFPSPGKFIKILNNTGFDKVKRYAQPSWRRPILHTFIAYKPQK